MNIKDSDITDRSYKLTLDRWNTDRASWNTNYFSFLFIYLTGWPIRRSREFLRDCRTKHAPCVKEILKWKSTWKFNLPCVCTSVCFCLLKWKFQTCLLNYSDFFFLCLVAMAVWNGCSISLLHAHTQHKHTALTVHVDRWWTLTYKEMRDIDIIHLLPYFSFVSHCS